ncbi:MAG: Na/Pi symporter [Thioalkalispiraceae bacterium]|jgi:phosphate:Na+ symporter
MIETIGGLGLFLLGMIIMTDGLRSLAGHAIRNALMRFTHTPLSGVITGATTTAILQSSSATTVAAIGFVGADLMSFPAALGIILGANIGTTVTGWIVVLLGFKFKLGTLVMPIILLGAILNLFGTKRLSRIGYTLAGFGLIFVGISFMQEGVSGLQQVFLPGSYASETLQSKLQLVLLGMIFTALTQSSSAGVAVALTALYADAINFEQAATLVIGMNIGTTVTAAIATIGSSVESKRTGYSHVIYNLFVSGAALLLISLYIYLWEAISGNAIASNAEVALVAFHSLFNILGVVVILPFTRNFAFFIQRIIPEKGPIYTQNLDQSLLSEPAVAITATRSTINNILVDLLIYINRLLGDTISSRQLYLNKLQQALSVTQTYINNIRPDEGGAVERQTLISMIHSMDHLQRLCKRCHETHRTRTIQKYAELENDRREMIISNAAIIQAIENNNWQEAEHHASAMSQEIENQVQPVREAIMENVAASHIDVQLATDYLEAIRWLDRVSDHIERITHHLAQPETRNDQ